MATRKNDGVYDAYLAHHGILGMHWGIRRYQNPDGTLTAAGRERYGYKYMKKRLDQTNYDQDISDELFKKSGADKEKLDEARQIIKDSYERENEIHKEAKNLFAEYNKKSEDEQKYYEAVSETASFIENRDPKDFTMEDFRWSTYLGTYEDGQQSQINAKSMWASEHPEIAKKLSDLHDEDLANRRESTKASKAIVTEALKNIGMEEVQSVEIGQKVFNRVRNAISEQNEKSSKYSYSYGLYDGAEGAHFTKQQKDAIKKARSWCDHLDKNKSTWWYIAEAVNDLNMGNIKVNDMTQADWDKINKYIREEIRTKGPYG